ncbi:hypothetical protein Tco_1220431 [Tanacetum coccineum]
MSNMYEDPIYDEVGTSYDSNIPSKVQDQDNYLDNVDEYYQEHDMQSDGVQSMSTNKQVKVVNDTLTSELARYKELVRVYEQWAKFKITDREQKIDEQMRIIISNRNRKETSLKSELHSVQMQLRSTVDHNKSMKEEVTTLKKDFKQKEDKYIEEFLDIKNLKENVKDRLFKQDQSVQTSALYNGHELVMTSHARLVVHDSEDTREIAEITRKRMIEKMKSPLYVENKVKIAPPDYSKENYLATCWELNTTKLVLPSQQLVLLEENRLKSAGYKVTTAGSRLLLLVKKLMLFRIHFDIQTKSLPLLFWIHPRRNYQEEPFTHKEEMAFSDSEVHNDKPCTKSCLKNYETLKKQYDDLVARKHETEFKAITYKRGLDTVEAQLVTYRNNESLRKITDKSKKGFGYSVVPLPHPLIYNRPNKLDLSYSGLEEFQQPEFEVYGLRANKSVCENSSNETKKILDAPSIEEWVSDNEDEVESPVVVEKKIAVPTIPKVDVVRPKQQEKPDRKTVRYAEMYRSKGPRRNQRNWNNLKFQQLGSDFVMNNKACFVCGSFDHLKKDCGKRIIKPVWKNTRVNDHYSTRMTHSNPRRNMIPQAVLMRSGIKVVNTAKPKDAHNAVKRNTFNAVKASACWVWMPKNRVVDHVSKNINASVTLKRLDYIDAQGRFNKEKEESRGVQQKQKDQEDEVFGRILSAKKMKTVEGLKTAGYKVSTAGSRLLLLVKKLMLLSNDRYALYDCVMCPFAVQQERKTRKDYDTRRGRSSTSSSSSFGQPSYSHPNDDDNDGNDEGNSRASTPPLLVLSTN